MIHLERLLSTIDLVLMPPITVAACYPEVPRSSALADDVRKKPTKPHYSKIAVNKCMFAVGLTQEKSWHRYELQILSAKPVEEHVVIFCRQLASPIAVIKRHHHHHHYHHHSVLYAECLLADLHVMIVSWGLGILRFS